MFTFTDFKPYISEKDFRQITEDTIGESPTPIIDQVYAVAIATIKDALYSYYDTNVIFGATPNWVSYPQIKRWAVCLCLYYLYERVPDKLVPERIVKNYDDTLELIGKISDGKISINLPNLIKSDGTKASKFRWGSNEKRTF